MIFTIELEQVKEYELGHTLLLFLWLFTNGDTRRIEKFSAENERRAGIRGYTGSGCFDICVYVYIDIFCVIMVSRKGGNLKRYLFAKVIICEGSHL